jgi:flagellar FliL protein
MAKKDKANQDKPETPPVDAENQAGRFGTKKRVIIIAAAAVLLLAAAAGGLTFLFVSGGEPALEAETAAQIAEDAKDGQEDAPAEEGVYYTMEPEFIVTLAPGSRYRALQTKIEVYSANSELLDKLKKHDPMLRHHLSNVFAAKTSQELLDRQGRERLKEEVKAEIEDKLARIGVRRPKLDDLFFTQFVME